MLLINLVKNLSKALIILFLFFAVSSFVFYFKPNEEEKYLGQQLEMYPLGFHGYSKDGKKFVIKQDMKSNIMVNCLEGVHKYETKAALYDGDKLSGCVIKIITDKGSKILTVSVDDGESSYKDLKTVESFDKDILYKVVSGKVKKKQFEKIHIEMEA